MATTKIPITVAEGDGIGPEIMAATLQVLNAAGAPLDIHQVEIGEKVYHRGEKTGIAASTWDTIRNTKAFLKAPITTPQGGGFKSLNVTIRTTLGLFANIRPCVAYAPYIRTKHPQMDVIVVRENEEDLYTGIEYQQSPETVHALKIISRPGCEKIVRYAFEYARAYNRKKVTCFTKDNILKLSDGLFRRVFNEIATEYTDLEHEHWIIDIGAAKMADTPEVFDVIVMPNLYGDILSDVAAQIAGSVGLAGSANIGANAAMFEAIHGSAPRRAGQNLANPSGLLLGSVMMLVHIGLPEAAALVHNAWLKTIEDGVHTYDIFKEGISKQKVGTKEFAQAICQRIGQNPSFLKEVHYTSPKVLNTGHSKQLELEKKKKKELVGVDIFVQYDGNGKQLQEKLTRIGTDPLKLTMIANRGVMVWPHSAPETSCIDAWRCRFMAQKSGGPITGQQIAAFLSRLADAGVDFMQTEHLYTFDGVPGFTLSQVEQ